MGNATKEQLALAALEEVGPATARAIAEKTGKLTVQEVTGILRGAPRAVVEKTREVRQPPRQPFTVAVWALEEREGLYG